MNFFSSIFNKFNFKNAQRTEYDLLGYRFLNKIGWHEVKAALAWNYWAKVHAIWRSVNLISQDISNLSPVIMDIKTKETYFKTGKYIEVFSDKTKKFVAYTHTISELFNTLIKAGFNVEQIIEPDSRKKYKDDPWYNKWDFTRKRLSRLPATIIFKARKVK